MTERRPFLGLAVGITGSSLGRGGEWVICIRASPLPSPRGHGGHGADATIVVVRTRIKGGKSTSLYNNHHQPPCNINLSTTITTSSHRTTTMKPSSILSIPALIALLPAIAALPTTTPHLAPLSSQGEIIPDKYIVVLKKGVEFGSIQAHLDVVQQAHSEGVSGVWRFGDQIELLQLV